MQHQAGILVISPVTKLCFLLYPAPFTSYFQFMLGKQNGPFDHKSCRPRFPFFGFIFSCPPGRVREARIRKLAELRVREDTLPTRCRRG